MRFKHTHRPGFWLGFIDFFTAGLFFLLYMPLGGLQDELDEILGRRTQRYWVAYLLGILTAFVYTLVWMSRMNETSGSPSRVLFFHNGKHILVTKADPGHQ